MSFVLRKISPAGRSAKANEATTANLTMAAISDRLEKGEYLEWFDADAKRGMGDDRWTGDIRKAKKFPTLLAALEFWNQQSRVRPYRSDGKPNRPLTAWSITVEAADD